jgi:hypothetical protein
MVPSSSTRTFPPKTPSDRPMTTRSSVHHHNRILRIRPRFLLLAPQWQLLDTPRDLQLQGNNDKEVCVWCQNFVGLNLTSFLPHTPGRKPCPSPLVVQWHCQGFGNTPTTWDAPVRKLYQAGEQTRVHLVTNLCHCHCPCTLPWLPLFSPSP